MKTSLPFYFKMIFLAGTILLIVSFFVEWYSFQIVQNGVIIVSWSYNIFFEWSTDLPLDFLSNEIMRPNNLEVSYILNILFLGILSFTVYTVLFQDLEQTEDVSSLKRYSLGFVCLIILLLFYIVIFPVMYLLPNELYFPSLVEIDLDFALNYFYSISYGFILQLIGFLLVTPYSMHYYVTINRFEKEASSPEKKIEAYIEKLQEPINFDKYIAEEEEIS